MYRAFDIASPKTPAPVDAPHAAVDVPNPDVAADTTQPPIPSTISEANFQRMMDFWREISDRQEQRIQDLVKELVELKTKEDNDKSKHKDQRMPTIDIKDVKKREEYDGDEKSFPIWYQRFKGLLVNRHSSWMDVFDAVEAFQEQVIENGDGKHEKFKKKLPQDSLAMDDPDMYARQLTSYLGSYTKGLLHAKVMKTQSRGAFELLRDLVYKGRNRNKN